MTFSATATHALRALSHLAADESGDVKLGRDLAREVGVPPHYLAKVLATLARAGVLAANRGVRGGYRLARAPDQITLLEVLEPIEGKRVRPGCLLRPGEACSGDGPCAAHDAWGGVKAALSTFLESTTLADIRSGVVPPALHGRRRKRGRPSDSTRPHHKRGPTR